MPKVDIPQPIADAALSILRPYVPNLTVERLQTLAFLEPEKPEKPEQLLTRQEAAEKLHLSIPTIDRMLRDGELVYRKIRRAVRIPLSEVEAVMQGRTQG